ncbi:ABC transporter substrate-binding protein [Halomonas aquamarina]|uniref:ABC transporter substrate-binding protein n=1 Tax=Vreelandella aquamarina TaxID=77097 RepID=A0ACC5VVA6_9GAMM|nr:ABC transporter substrate-binding protein [Halomonas aquamarina]MBZ5487716.1 ABC transporter substrate-binding protein [Halomonas aquamarina]
MMLKRTTAAAASLMLASSAYAATDYPLTLESCGHEITLEKPPERVVSIGQAPTEILYMLGLADKVVGTALWISPVLEEFEAMDAGVERLANDAPSYESVVAKRPDLVISAYEWMIGPAGVVGTPEMFEDMGIASWTMPTDCVGKSNQQSMDGARTALFDTGLIHESIATLAELFDVTERGDQVVGELQAREAAAMAKAESLALPDDITGVFWYSSADLGIDPYVAGVNSVPDWMMHRLGIRNVVTSHEEWPTVGWETIARSNPTFIAAARMDRRRFPADDIAAKREFLVSDPVTRETDAVQQNRIIEIDAHALDPSVRAILALETLADQLAEFDLAP